MSGGMLNQQVVGCGIGQEQSLPNVTEATDAIQKAAEALGHALVAIGDTANAEVRAHRARVMMDKAYAVVQAASVFERVAFAAAKVSTP